MRVCRRRALQVTGISKCKGPEAGRAHLRNSKMPVRLPDGEGEGCARRSEAAWCEGLVGKGL